MMQIPMVVVTMKNLVMMVIQVMQVMTMVVMMVVMVIMVMVGVEKVTMLDSDYVDDGNDDGGVDDNSGVDT